jgi:hypothetical protein
MRKLTLDEHLWGLVEGQTYTLPGWFRPQVFKQYELSRDASRIMATFDTNRWTVWFMNTQLPNPAIQARIDKNEGLSTMETGFICVG